jgi:hypothetical protein
MRDVVLVIMVLVSSFAYSQDVDSLDLEQKIDSYDTQATDESASEEVTHTTTPPEDLEQTTNYKDEKIEIKKFDQKKWKEVIGNQNYEEKPEKTKPEEIKPRAASSPWNSELLRIVSFTVIIGVVLLIILSITKNVSLDYKLKKKQLSGNFDEPIENIEDLDINALLESTIASGNLRLAIRLYYLGLLKKLNEAGIINWQKEKTNKDYLFEIYKRNSYYDEVKLLTNAYERVWYGEHSLNKDTFEKLANNFQTLNQKFNTSNTL